jgi:hypothetical protein
MKANTFRNLFKMFYVFGHLWAHWSTNDLAMQLFDFKSVICVYCENLQTHVP